MQEKITLEGYLSGSWPKAPGSWEWSTVSLVCGSESRQMDREIQQNSLKGKSWNSQ